MSYHILYIDPSIADAQQTMLVLRREGLDATFQHVLSFDDFEESMNKAFQSGISYDLILSEFDLQGNSVLNVCDYLNEKKLPIPVIVVSSVASEKAVSSCISRGVEDYIYKTHLAFVQNSIMDVMNMRFSRNDRALRDKKTTVPILTVESAPLSSSRIEVPALSEKNRTPPNEKGILDEDDSLNLKEELKHMKLKIDDLNETISTLTINNQELQRAFSESRIELKSYQDKPVESDNLREALLRIKTLEKERDDAQEAEMQLRIELQEAIITGNQLREAITNAEAQMSDFQEKFKLYETHFNSQLLKVNATQEQIISTKEVEHSLVLKLEEEKKNVESKLSAAQESANEIVHKLSSELAYLKSLPKGNPEKENQLLQELSEANSTISQLRADLAQADSEIERLETEMKLVDDSFKEKSNKLVEFQQKIKVLEQSLAQKSAILNSLNLAIVMVNAAGEITYWNEGAAVFHAVPAGSAIGKRSDDVMKYKYASAKERSSVIDALQNVGQWDGRIRYKTPEGEQKHADMFIARLDDEVGNSLGVLTILTDASKRHAIETQLQVFNSTLLPAIETAPVDFFAFDDRGILTLIKGKSNLLQRLNPSVEEGKSIFELFGKYSLLLDAFKRVLSGEELAVELSIPDQNIQFLFSPLVTTNVTNGAVGVALSVKIPEVLV